MLVHKLQVYIRRKTEKPYYSLFDVQKCLRRWKFVCTLYIWYYSTTRIYMHVKMIKLAPFKHIEIKWVHLRGYHSGLIEFGCKPVAFGVSGKRFFPLRVIHLGSGLVDHVSQFLSASKIGLPLNMEAKHFSLAFFIFVPRLFEEKRGDTVFGFPWWVVDGSWWLVPSL